MPSLNQTQLNTISGYCRNFWPSIFCEENSADDCLDLVQCFQDRKFDENFQSVCSKLTEPGKEKALELAALFMYLTAKSHSSESGVVDDLIQSIPMLGSIFRASFDLQSIVSYTTVSDNQVKKVSLKDGSHLYLLPELASVQIKIIDDYFQNNPVDTNQIIHPLAVKFGGTLSLSQNSDVSKNAVVEEIKFLLAKALYNKLNLTICTKEEDEDKYSMDGIVDYLRNIARSNRISVLCKFFASLSPHLLQTLLNHRDFYAFTTIAGYGALHFVKFIESFLSDKQLQEAYMTDTCYVLRSGAASGNLEKIDYFAAKLEPDVVINAITRPPYLAITVAIDNGQLEVLKYYLSKLETQSKSSFIEKHTFFMVRSAVSNNQPIIFKYFATLLSKNEIIQAVVYDNYESIFYAAIRGNIDFFSLLISYLDHKEIIELVKLGDYSLIKGLMKDKHQNIVRCLLQRLSADEIKEVKKACDLTSLLNHSQNPQTLLYSQPKREGFDAIDPELDDVGFSCH